MTFDPIVLWIQWCVVKLKGLLRSATAEARLDTAGKLGKARKPQNKGMYRVYRSTMTAVALRQCESDANRPDEDDCRSSVLYVSSAQRLLGACR